MAHTRDPEVLSFILHRKTGGQMRAQRSVPGERSPLPSSDWYGSAKKVPCCLTNLESKRSHALTSCKNNDRTGFALSFPVQIGTAILTD